ncbi:TRADD-N-associated membrane domain-containing protein [Streptomyces violens]|uniref:TRADD-N-associated membrane domain-containing protein n=1 Tax=Streptomyces violens TaxID=66377 RepID=UPI001B80DEC0|nr:hypothetical protein [Streptomyces violens]
MSRDDFDDPSYAVSREDYEEAMQDDDPRWQARRHPAVQVGENYVFTGDAPSIVIGNAYAGPVHAGSGDIAQKSEGESLAEQRQRFFFDFLKESLKQAEWTFRLSVCFMAGGAAILLAGGVLALVHAGNPDISYLPLVTALTGALITVGGGALAVHARRARAHITEQANRLDVKIDADHKMERATSFIDRVNDPNARDRLNSAAALKALDMQSDPDTMGRLLPNPEERPGRIGPGNTAR